MAVRHTVPDQIFRMNKAIGDKADRVESVLSHFRIIPERNSLLLRLFAIQNAMYGEFRNEVG